MHYEAGEDFTYGSLEETTNRLACALHERGIMKGDVVCLYATKHISGVIVLLATLKLGAVFTPCRAAHKASESSHHVGKKWTVHALFVFLEETGTNFSANFLLFLCFR